MRSKVIQDTFNRYAIPQLVNMNYMGVDVYPRLKASKINIPEMGSFAAAITALLNGGILTADNEIEKHVRGLFNLPDKPEKEEPEPAELGQVDLGRVQLDDHGGAVTFRRELRDEEHICSLAEIKRNLDSLKQRYVDAVQRVRNAQVKQALKFLGKAIREKDVASINKFRLKRQTEMENEIRKILREIYFFGRHQVSNEAERQKRNPDLPKQILAKRQKGVKQLQDVKDLLNHPRLERPDRVLEIKVTSQFRL